MANRSEVYSAGLMSEAPWFLEFKKMVFLKQDGVDQEEIKRRCIEENLFGMPKEYRARRTYGYLLNRLNLMDDTLINLFCSSDLTTQKIINLIMIAKGDRLFSEFLNEVYREKYIVGFTELSASDVNVFFTEKAAHDEIMGQWIETTFKRLRSGYFQFLVDANLLKKEKSKYYITPPILDIALERYLQFNGDERLLKAMTGVS